MSATEFTGAPLVLGAVAGVRAFDIDSFGRLHGVTHKQVWTPGENFAECKVPTISADAMSRYRLDEMNYKSLGIRNPYKPTRYRVRDEPHDIGSCTCGFYAYYAGSNDYANDERVQAVIEGWGETAIGTRGFRTSKARIVALCVQRGPGFALDGWKNKTVASVLDRYAGIFGAAACLPGVLLNAFRGQWIWAALLALLFVGNIALWLMGRSRRSRVARSTTRTESSYIDIEKIRRNYPGVPIFTDFKRMVAEFPTSRGEEPTPETDPDFWTRGV